MAPRHAARIRGEGERAVRFGQPLQTSEASESVLDVVEERRWRTSGRPDAGAHRQEGSTCRRQPRRIRPESQERRSTRPEKEPHRKVPEEGHSLGKASLSLSRGDEGPLMRFINRSRAALSRRIFCRQGLKIRKQRSTGDLEKRGTGGSIRSNASSASWMSTESSQSQASASVHTDSNASFVIEVSYGACVPRLLRDSTNL